MRAYAEAALVQPVGVDLQPRAVQDAGGGG